MLLPPGTVDAQGEIDSILELQRTHGNRAVVQLLGAADAPADVGGRADRLVRAVTFAVWNMTIDMTAATEALTGLSGTEVVELQKEFKRRAKVPFSTVLELAKINDAERNQLKTLLQGSAIEKFDDRGARKVGEATGAFVGGIASSLGFDVDPDVASKVGGAVLESQARAGYEAERPDNERVVATRRHHAEAHEIRSLMGKDDKERLFALIGGSLDDRMAIADAYSKEYGTSMYNDLTAKLRGRELERFQALWGGAKAAAEAAALADDTEKRKKAEAKAAKLAPIPLFADARKEAAAEAEKARGRQEQRVESLASSGELEKVLASAGPDLEGVIEKDQILGFLRRGNVPELMAARLVRAHREDKLTAAMLEEALRSLHDAAEVEAAKSLIDSALAPVAPLVTPLFVAGFYKRLEQEFDWQSKGGTLKAIIAKTGDKARRQRNEALRAGGGLLEPWQELDFALRADPKDMETVKRVLTSLSADELEDPRQKAKPAAGSGGEAARTEPTVAEQYHENTKRWLHDDLKGDIQQQKVKQLFQGGEEVVEGAELDQWLHGGKFVSKLSDPGERIAEEGRWLYGKLFNYERLVMENRGVFAKGRDWLGHIDKTLVDIASRDAAKAKAGIDNALLEHPADLAEAARQLTELRLVERRLDTNLAAYRKGTAEAWDDFVNFVAEVVTAIGTGGESLAMSFLRKAVITAAKTALYTIGTKLVLNGKRYATIPNIVADLRVALGSGLSAGLSEKFVAPLADDLAKSVTAWATKRGMAPALAGKATQFIVQQEGDVFVGGITTALATGGDIEGLGLGDQLHGYGMGKLGSGINTGGKKLGKKWDARRRRAKGGPADEPATSGGARHGEATEATPARAGEEPGAPSRETTDTSDEAGDLGGDGADIDAATVPMALPEPVSAKAPVRPGGALEDPAGGRKRTKQETGPEPQPNAAGDQDYKTLMKQWKKPDPTKLRPGSVKDAEGAPRDRPNIKIHEDIANPDIDALMVEMERTEWGSRIAEGLRNGDLQVTFVPPWELPFGGLHYPGGETYVAWSGSIQEIAAHMHHEGSHWLDPNLASDTGSRLGRESEARVFEYQYRDLVGLPAFDPIHAATRQVYDDMIEATRTAEMPDGDVKAARVAADRALHEALRRDHKRAFVESRKEERKKLAARRDVRKLNVDEILGSPADPRQGPPDGPLEVEIVFGDEPTSPGGSPGKRETKAAPEATGPDALPNDPVIPPPKPNSEQLRLEELLASAIESETRAAADEKRAIRNKDKGAAAASRERFDAAGAEIHRIVQRLAMLPKPPGDGGGAAPAPSPAPSPSSGGPAGDPAAPGPSGDPAAPSPGGDLSPRSGNTIPGMGVGVPKTKGAVLPEYRGKPPVMGNNIAHVVTSAEEAAALYLRLHGEGQDNTLGTTFAEFEQERWEHFGGKGDAPFAWVRASDGVIRFNFSKFKPPSLGGYSNAPIGPMEAPGGKVPAPAPGGPEGTSKPAVFPGSGHALEPGMRPARVATDAEVRFTVENNPMKVHQSRTDALHEQYYRMDHGAGEVPDAFWSGSTIIVKKSYPLPDNALVGDKDNPYMRARTLEPSEYEGVKRDLTPQDVKDIAAAVARVRAALEKKLIALKEGRGGGESLAKFNKLIDALRSAGFAQNQLVIDHAQRVWDAVHDPALIAQVLSDAYGESLKDVGTGGQSAINRALMREAAKGGPIYEVPLGSDIDKFAFFKHWVQSGRRFYDQVDTAAHGNMTHLVQDLVVDVAFARLGIDMTSVRFRQALGNVEALAITEPGRELWEQIYDATDNGINQPEYLMSVIREVLELRDLR